MKSKDLLSDGMFKCLDSAIKVRLCNANATVRAISHVVLFNNYLLFIDGIKPSYLWLL